MTGVEHRQHNGLYNQAELSRHLITAIETVGGRRRKMPDKWFWPQCPWCTNHWLYNPFSV